MVHFLRELRAGLETRVAREVKSLRSAQAAFDPPTAANAPLWSHDRPYYAEMIRAVRGEGAGKLFPQYFSVGNCFKGIDMVTRAVFGVRLTVAPVSDADVWHPSVRKLVVEHETEGVLGVIYCDM